MLNYMLRTLRWASQPRLSRFISGLFFYLLCAQWVANFFLFMACGQSGMRFIIRLILNIVMHMKRNAYHIFFFKKKLWSKCFFYLSWDRENKINIDKIKTMNESTQRSVAVKCKRNPWQETNETEYIVHPEMKGDIKKRNAKKILKTSPFLLLFSGTVCVCVCVCFLCKIAIFRACAVFWENNHNYRIYSP